MKYTLVIHGGAGTIRKIHMTEEKEKGYSDALEASLDAGYSVLENKGSAIDAVIAAVRSMEDNVLFNAGKGAVFTKDGKQEMDAAIMDGKDLSAGAVAAVRNIRNPIELAYTIMRKSKHVMMTGQGAFDFAKMHGLRTEADEYFFVQQRWDQLKKAQETGKTVLDHDVVTGENKFGTVGAVACDQFGNIAAATSTGGMYRIHSAVL